MGKPKLLLPWRKGLVIDAVLSTWCASVDTVVVVMRRDDEALANACRKHRVNIVQPSVDPPAMKESVIAAIEWISATREPDERDAWLLAPADQPRLNGKVIQELLAAHRQDWSSVKLPFVGGERGHPVLFPWSASRLLSTIPEDRGVNVLLEQLSVRKVVVESPEILDDLDTPDDYQHLLDQDGESEPA